MILHGITGNFEGKYRKNLSFWSVLRLVNKTHTSNGMFRSGSSGLMTTKKYKKGLFYLFYRKAKFIQDHMESKEEKYIESWAELQWHHEISLDIFIVIVEKAQMSLLTLCKP